MDLAAVITAAGAKHRKITRPRYQSGPRALLLGFPLEQRLGEPKAAFHWLAIRNLILTGRSQAIPGFRDSEENRQRRDREMLKSTKQLLWRRTANFSSYELRKRGYVSEPLKSISILLLGAGSLGASVAETLARMGVLSFGIVDGDHVLMGNLTRHTLSMGDAGHLKADAVARRLRALLPDIQAEAFPVSFPSNDRSKHLKFDRYDMIVDCTASNEVLESLANFPWSGVKRFVSLSMTWAAKGLFAFGASEAAFPVRDFGRRFESLGDARPDKYEDVTEGIGCWHPRRPPNFE
jgi:ThiF family